MFDIPTIFKKLKNRERRDGPAQKQKNPADKNLRESRS
jgi:hypothetical protein